MKRILSFVLVIVLVLSFSVMIFAQQATPKKQTTERAKTVQPAKTEQKATTEHKEHLKLNKDEIISLQNALAKAGVYKGKVDGVLGKATKRALRKYQKANNLKVTGEPNEETLTKLGVSYTAPSMEKKGAVSETTKKPESKKPESETTTKPK